MFKVQNEAWGVGKDYHQMCRTLRQILFSIHCPPLHGSELAILAEMSPEIITLLFAALSRVGSLVLAPGGRTKTLLRLSACSVPLTAGHH